MLAALVLWAHAIAALLFAGVAVWAQRAAPAGLPQRPLVAALTVLAVWALAVAGLGGGDAATRLVDGVRTLSLLGLMLALARSARTQGQAGTAPILGVVALVAAVVTLLEVVASAMPPRAIPDHDAHAIANVALLLRMMVGVAALVLVQDIHATSDRAAAKLVAIALALIWLADLNLTCAAYVAGAWPAQMVLLRGLVAIAAAGCVGMALHRRDGRPVAVSRTVALRSLSMVAVGGYFALLALVTSGLGAVGGAQARLWQTAFVIGSAAAVLTLLSSTWLRAWARVIVAKHFFRHRYDYRAEWLRFTGTLGRPQDTAPLAERVVKAVADLTESPAGLLLVRDGAALGIATGWNWPDLPAGDAGEAIVRHLAASERIVEIDRLRRGDGPAGDLAALPQWMLDDESGWALVPLLHQRHLVGAILLARPMLDRALDWEDFDLLKVAGRQVASYLAEARAQEALDQAERFDEFNRRFAFIVHDIKNLVSGLSLVARNAERHADNPAFRADMVATLQDSAAKLGALLTRLAPGTRVAAEPPVAMAPMPLAQRIAAAHGAGHAVVAIGDAGLVAHADPARLEQVLRHLVQNAVEASAPAEPVTIALSAHGDTIELAVIDRGAGMSPAFVRDRLFRPFVSSKPGGFGIGAFEARLLTEAMGGRLSVESREGEGSTFRIHLPAAPPGAAAPLMSAAA